MSDKDTKPMTKTVPKMYCYECNTKLEFGEVGEHHDSTGHIQFANVGVVVEPDVEMEMVTTP